MAEAAWWSARRASRRSCPCWLRTNSDSSCSARLSSLVLTRTKTKYSRGPESTATDFNFCERARRGGMWYREARWRNRLLAEHALMEERFPQFVLTQDQSELLVWRGILEPVEGAQFIISATMPRNYPYAAPQLRVEEP